MTTRDARVNREREAYDAGRLAGFEEGIEAAALDVDRLSEAVCAVQTAGRGADPNVRESPNETDRAYAWALVEEYDRLTPRPS